MSFVPGYVNLAFIFFSIFILYWSIVALHVVLVSGVQQSDLVIHIHISTLFQILVPYKLLQNIENLV